MIRWMPLRFEIELALAFLGSYWQSRKYWVEQREQLAGYVHSHSVKFAIKTSTWPHCEKCQGKMYPPTTRGAKP